MKLGTISYGSKIYNLDHMSTEELKSLLQQIESDKKNAFNSVKDKLKEQQK